MPTVLITGSNRGLGLDLVRQYAALGWRVHACCRDPGAATALGALAAAHPGQVAVHALDVADFAAVDRLAATLHGEALDVLFNNAGVFGDRCGFGEVDYDVWARTLRTNTMAPLKLAEAFVGHVARSAQRKIANVTSLMGSIADNGSGGHYVYRSSKAALNMVNRSLAHDLRDRGVTCLVLHPGWVKTDMGGPGAPLEIPESVAGMIRVVERATLADSGKFYDWEGEELPW